jgi:hypothetical protein
MILFPLTLMGRRPYKVINVEQVTDFLSASSLLIVMMYFIISDLPKIESICSRLSRLNLCI